MKKLTVLNLLLVSLLSGLVLSVFYVFSLRLINEATNQTLRYEMVLSIAKEIERFGIPETFTEAESDIAQYARNHSNSRGEVRPPLWIVDSIGEVMASTQKSPLPVSWSEIDKPLKGYGITIKYRFMTSDPEILCVRLSGPDPIYLVLSLGGRRVANLFWGTSFILVFATVAVAIFLALFITFFYLKRKSKQAQGILARLEKGDLKARFRIQPFDQMANLMLDFNRMADEIEKLVGRVQTAEQARRHLLRELSHDLRTPLTSLRTSIDTLRVHADDIDPTDRREFLSMIDEDLSYLIYLLEDLFFIAEIDKPSYKNSAKRIDLNEVILSELKSRQSHHPGTPELIFPEPPPSAPIWGDLHLILRLFKNAFDNALRFAKTQVVVRIVDLGPQWQVQIQDDGPGLTHKELADYGVRRRNRTEWSHVNNNGPHFSLGLGSVIIKAIAELHHGQVEISNQVIDHQTQGALLKISFPKLK